MGRNGGVSSGDGAAATALRAGLAPKRERPGILKPLDWVRVLARRKPLGFVGFLILLVVALAAAFAPLVAPYGYAEVSLTNRLQPPGGAHLFGTDNLGRDILSRVIWGARISLGISLGAMIIAKSLATVIAMFSAYYGGWFDKIMQRFVDVWIALPTLIILITLLGVLGANPISLIIVIGLANAPQSSRLVRSVVLSVREEPYIEAARSLGMRDSRIMLLHVLPNIMHIIIYSASVTLGSVILIVASLGFLGYGVPPPHPDLGAMLSGDGLTYMRRMPWMALWPGLVITLVVFAFNVFGDALRDLLDPRMRGA